MRLLKAFIIAFSSNFIPRLVYVLSVNKVENSDNGFLNFTLSYFDTTDFVSVYVVLLLIWENQMQLF